MISDCTLRLIGYVALAYLLYKFAVTLYRILFPFVIAKPKNLKLLAGAKWAVITGSTDGIGKAYAFEFAEKGFDLILISRNQSKLDDISEEIKQKHPDTQIKTIAFDFTNPNLADYQSKILDQLEKFEIGILINNVGLSYEYPGRFSELAGGLERLVNITIVNMLPMTIFSYTILNQMVKRNKGIIVNVSSSSAYHELCYLAVYSASKKYVNWLSAILRKEYSHTNIIIQTVCPMYVTTKMSKVKNPSFFVLSTTDFARSAVNSIGLVEETAGCLVHELQTTLFFGLLPKFLVDKYKDQQFERFCEKMSKKKGIRKDI